MVVPEKNKDGCKSFKKTDFDNFGYEALFLEKVALELPVVMVELGNCAFSTKVRNI